MRMLGQEVAWAGGAWGALCAGGALALPGLLRLCRLGSAIRFDQGIMR